MTVTLGDLAQFITALAALGGMLISWRNLHKIEQVHIATNSMKDALVTAAGQVGHAEGLEEGRAEKPKI